MADEFLHKKIVQLSPNQHTIVHCARKIPQFFSAMTKSEKGESDRMYQPGKHAGWGLAIASLALLAAAAAWIGYGIFKPHIAQDYEDCAEEAQTNSSSGTEYIKLITRCSERFAGRRKPGGGYTYFDFMQNRTFDIAGPNPTEAERKQIDRSYMQFLGTQRREMLLSDLAKAQAGQEAAFDGAQQDTTPPLASTPRIPLPAKRPLGRAKSCEDGSLSCSWAKLTAAVRNAFASTPAAKP